MKLPVKKPAMHWLMVPGTALNRAERMACACDLLQLYSFTQAPVEVLLRGHSDLLRSYEWHMTSANRQKKNFDRLVEKGKLPVKEACFALIG